MSLVKSISDEIIQSITSGQLSVGEKLYSIRKAAKYWHVSKNTIIDVYEKLVSLGYIYSRSGSGFYVAPLLQEFIPKNDRLNEATDRVSLLTKQLTEHDELRIGDGRLPTDWMETSGLQAYLKKRREPSLSNDFSYGMPKGSLELRTLLSHQLGLRGIPIISDNILMTFGVNHALDLIVRSYINEGDRVLVETPGYYPFYAHLTLHNVEMISIERTNNGFDFQELERKLRQYRPKLFFIQPNAHNPTGLSLNNQTIKKVIELTKKYQLILIEDDPFIDISPNYKGFLYYMGIESKNIIYLSTYSKTLSAGLRCGYIVANENIIERLTNYKMLTIVNTSNITETIVYDLIVSGRYRRHISKLRKRISETREIVKAQLESFGFIINDLSSNHYLWVRLPKEITIDRFIKYAQGNGVFIAPGYLFSHDQVSYESYLRINIAYANNPYFIDFIRKSIKDLV